MRVNESRVNESRVNESKRTLWLSHLMVDLDDVRTAKGAGHQCSRPHRIIAVNLHNAVVLVVDHVQVVLK